MSESACDGLCAKCRSRLSQGYTALGANFAIGKASLGRGSVQRWVASGAGGTWVIRRAPVSFGLARLRFVLAAQRHVALSRNLSPEPFQTDDGQQVLVSCDHLYWCEPLVESDTKASDWATILVDAAATLRSLHKALSDFDHQHSAACRLMRPADDADRFLHSLRQDHLNRGSASIAAAISWKLDHLELLRDVQLAPSPHLIHGDYYGANLIAGRDRRYKVIDFLKTCHFPRAYEVIRAAVMFCRPSVDDDDSRHRVGEFLCSYAAGGAEFPAAEQSPVRSFLAVQCRESYGLGIADSDELRSFALQRIEALKWLAKNESWIDESVRGNV